ncbi:MAG: hypothetical protein QOG22_1439 [Pseudonocardiales bacterium]|nr:hypothetical protein [Pseudonocardiales bacterium]
MAQHQGQLEPTSDKRLSSELGYFELVGRSSTLILREALGTFEAFINWRPRWVLMEETQYRLNLLRDNMDYYLVTTPADGLSKQQLDLFYAEQQLIWADAGRRWVQFRMPLARVHCHGPAKAGKASRRGGTSAGQSNEPN